MVGLNLRVVTLMSETLKEKAIRLEELGRKVIKNARQLEYGELQEYCLHKFGEQIQQLAEEIHDEATTIPKPLLPAYYCPNCGDFVPYDIRGYETKSFSVEGNLRDEDSIDTEVVCAQCTSAVFEFPGDFLNFYGVETTINGIVGLARRTLRTVINGYSLYGDEIRESYFDEVWKDFMLEVEGFKRRLYDDDE